LARKAPQNCIVTPSIASKRSIVIIGGGFAGTTLARALHQRLPDGYEMLLISEESYTTFNPMLPEAVGASVFPEQVVVPIRAMLSKTGGRFVMGVVTAVDAQRKILTCNTLAGITEIPYEHLVFAFGNRARLAGLNLVGLKRRGYERSAINAVRAAFRLMFRSEGVFAERVEEARQQFAAEPLVVEMLAFIDTPSRRGLIRSVDIEAGDDEAV